MQDFETVDGQGNIWFIRGEGILITFGERDDSSVVVNATTNPRYLSIPALEIYRQIGVSPTSSTDWRIALTPEELHPVPRVGSVTFSVMDISPPVPLSLWSGVIRERNLYQ